MKEILSKIDWTPILDFIKNIVLILFSITVIPLMVASIYDNIYVAWACAGLFYIVISFRKKLKNLIWKI